MNFERLVGFVFGLCLALSGTGMVVHMVNNAIMSAEQGRWRWFWESMIVLPLFACLAVLGVILVYVVTRSNVKKGGKSCL